MTLADHAGIAALDRAKMIGAPHHLPARGGTFHLGADAVAACVVTVPIEGGEEHYYITERDPVVADLFGSWRVSVTDDKRSTEYSSIDLAKIAGALESGEAQVGQTNRTLRELAADPFSPLDLVELPGGFEPPDLRTELAGEYWLMDTRDNRLVGVYTTLESAEREMQAIGEIYARDEFGGVPLGVEEKKPEEFDRLPELLDDFDPQAFRAAQQRQPRMGTRPSFAALYEQELNRLQHRPPAPTTPPREKAPETVAPAVAAPVSSASHEPNQQLEYYSRDLPQKERTRLGVEDLHRRVAEFKDSAIYLTFLDFQRSMRNYSPSNCAFLDVQAMRRGMHLSLVMPAKGRPRLENGEPVRDENGYRKVLKPGWNAYGRMIRKGEKSLRVFAPILVDRDKVRNQNLAETGRAEDEKVLVGYKLVPVFDISQTEGEPLPLERLAPRLGHELAAEEEVVGFRAALESSIEAKGFTISYGGLPGETNGVTDYASREVTVESSLAPAASVKTLAHELGHIHLDHENRRGGDGIHRGRLEVEAESYAYLALREVGIPSDDYSLGYLAVWSQDDPDSLMASVGDVTKKFEALLKEPVITASVAKMRESGREPAPVAQELSVARQALQAGVPTHDGYGNRRSDEELEEAIAARRLEAMITPDLDGPEV